MTTGKKILQCSENSPSFYDSVTDIFTEEKSLYGTQEVGTIEKATSTDLTTFSLLYLSSSLILGLINF
jgi:hypothetical protein